MLKSKRKKILGVISLLFVKHETRKLILLSCWEEWAVERNVKVKKNSSGEKYYEVNPRQKYKSTDEGMIPINIHHLQFGRKRIKMSFSFNGLNT